MNDGSGPVGPRLDELVARRDELGARFDAAARAEDWPAADEVLASIRETSRAIAALVDGATR